LTTFPEYNDIAVGRKFNLGSVGPISGITPCSRFSSFDLACSVSFNSDNSEWYFVRLGKLL
jgi:hypothetical protein